MARVLTLFAVALIVLLASPALAQVHSGSFGPVSLTGDQTLYVHLLSQAPASAPSPIQVAVTFLNAQGEAVADAGGVCEGICSPPLVPLVPGVVTTVAVGGSALGLEDTESATIKPLVSVFGAGFSHLLTTLEVIGATTPFRTAIQFEPIAASAQLGVPQTVRIGPLTLAPGEVARLIATNNATVSSQVRLFFVDAAGIRIGSDTSVDVAFRNSASIELLPTAEPMLVSGGATSIGAGMDLTLEILDATTNVVKARLPASGGTGSGGGSGKGGGGGGSAS